MKTKLLAISLTAATIAMSGCITVPQGGQGGTWNGPQAGNGYPPQNGGYGNSAPGPMAGGGGTGSILTPILIEILMRQLGLSSQQAYGGAGSIFGFAQQHLNPDQFSVVRNAVPGIDSILSAAPAAAGGSGNTLADVAGVVGSFQNLGMNPTMIGQFVPVIMDYVKSTGNSAAVNLLGNSLRSGLAF